MRGYRRKKLLLNNFRAKVSANKMVDFYTDIGTLTSAVGTAVFKCVRDYPAKGWIRADSAEGSEDIEAKIEKYMKEHTATATDIESLFSSTTFILDGGNASSHIEDKSSSSESDTISLSGARALVEELAKNLPKVEWEDM